MEDWNTGDVSSNPVLGESLKEDGREHGSGGILMKPDPDPNLNHHPSGGKGGGIDGLGLDVSSLVPVVSRGPRLVTFSFLRGTDEEVEVDWIPSPG